jgi:hypothetical protein
MIRRTETLKWLYLFQAKVYLFGMEKFGKLLLLQDSLKTNPVGDKWAVDEKKVMGSGPVLHLFLPQKLYGIGCFGEILDESGYRSCRILFYEEATVRRMKCFNCYSEYIPTLKKPLCPNCGFCYYCREFSCFHSK